MRAESLTGQVVAVLSRRTPAFQPAPGEPSTFPGRIHQASVKLSALREHTALAADTHAQRQVDPISSDATTYASEVWSRSSYSNKADTHHPRVWVVALAGAVSILIFALGVVVFANSHFNPSVPAKPISQSSTTPMPSQQRAAISLSELLTQSAADRVTVTRTVDEIFNCAPDLPQMPQVLSNAVASRQQLLSKLARLPERSTLPPSLLADLTKAWQADIAADQAYSRWASDEIAQGCVPNNTSGPSYQSSVEPSIQASAYSEAFVNGWNPLATQYGLITFEPGQI